MADQLEAEDLNLQIEEMERDLLMAPTITEAYKKFREEDDKIKARCAAMLEAIRTDPPEPDLSVLVDELRELTAAVKASLNRPLFMDAIPAAEPMKAHDWILLDKETFKSVYEMIKEGGDDYSDFSGGDDDFARKIIFTFKCNVTGEIKIEERVS